ncbi:tetratricopeptide repeat protein [Leucobacter weissii]|uniref:Tetratricopeptide repeat protein n=1 Tax=Leucobacter weissii TaxID=1983706 RepID=A0A939MHT0_9MICO|nr:tetratricopeptide repeat protein [Leucobacter weissii]MBO1901188.1 tetratricopeptide repeat protein [Leucobacter weissii]
MVQHIPGGAVDLSHLAAAGQPRGAAVDASGAGAGPVGAVELPSLVIELTDRTFEQAVQLSSTVPVVVDLWAEWCQPCKTLGPVLEKLTDEFDGRIVLAKVDVDANPGLAQAFQAQSIPTVVALVGGRPVPLFQGAVPEQQVREVFTQLLQLAEQQGVSGRVSTPDSPGGEADDPGATPINPAHAEALDALERGDYAAAVRAYEAVLAKAPADQEARDALAQVKLLHRLEGANADEVRAAAAANPGDVAAQVLVADLDLSGGHVEDAFLRLLELFASSEDEDARTRIREHLLELFAVVGVADPRVIAARGRLASLLY